MKKHNLKGRKIKSLFNRYDNIDLNSLYQLYNILLKKWDLMLIIITMKY